MSAYYYEDSVVLGENPDILIEPIGHIYHAISNMNLRLALGSRMRSKWDDRSWKDPYSYINGFIYIKMNFLLARYSRGSIRRFSIIFKVRT